MMLPLTVTQSPEVCFYFYDGKYHHRGIPKKISANSWRIIDPEFGGIESVLNPEKANKVTENDLARIARRDFGEEHADEVLSMLHRYGAKQGPEHLRVRAGILKLAAGDIRQVALWIENACIDFRDVVMDAEMPNYLYREKDHTRVQAVIDSDWKAYCEWFKKA